MADLDQAFEKIMQDPDGRRILERAFRADPRRTAIELRYLGQPSIAGELENDLAVELFTSGPPCTLAEAAAGARGELVRSHRAELPLGGGSGGPEGQVLVTTA